MSSLIVKVVRLNEFITLEGADNIEAVKVDGWYCVIKKDSFKAGDLAIYVPQDSIMPQDLVDKYNLTYLKKGNKVGLLKLNKFKILSQGLVLEVPEGMKAEEGENVAEKLGITKWEPEEPEWQRGGSNGGPQATKLRPNPNFKRYDKPEHLKWFPDIFATDEDVVITEKIHGTNSRFGYITKPEPRGFFNKLIQKLFGRWIDKKEFAVGSANVHLCGNEQKAYLFYKDNPYWKIAKRLNLSRILKEFSEKIGEDVTLFGEIYGPGIQDLGYGLKNDIDIVFFDLKIGENYADYLVLKHFCNYYNLKTVPVLYFGPWYDGLAEEYTGGKSTLAPTQIREGCVIKSIKEENDMHIGRKSVKSISEAYLTRQNATEFH